MMEDYTPDYYRYHRYRAKKFLKVVGVCRKLLRELPSAEPVRTYLKDRNISPEIQELFGCGYFPTDEELSALRDQLPWDELLQLGLVYPYHVQNDDQRVFTDRGVLGRHNLVIPYYDTYGTIVGLMGRTILSESDRTTAHLQKYKYSTFNKSLYLFGAHLAKHNILSQDQVIIVEGQIDAMSCVQNGWSHVVGLGGTTLSRYQFQMLRRYTGRISLLLDNDPPGQAAQQRIMRRYEKFAIFDSIKLPNTAKDIDGWLRAGNRLEDLPIR